MSSLHAGLQLKAIADADAEQPRIKFQARDLGAFQIQVETLKIARNSYGDEAEIALEKLRAARDGYYTAFARLGLPETALRALHGTHWEKTWDGAFEAARARI